MATIIGVLLGVGTGAVIGFLTGLIKAEDNKPSHVGNCGGGEITFCILGGGTVGAITGGSIGLVIDIYSIIKFFVTKV